MFFLEKETQETRSYTLKLQLFSTQYWFKKGQSQLFGKMNLENVYILPNYGLKQPSTGSFITQHLGLSFLTQCWFKLNPELSYRSLIERANQARGDIVLQFVFSFIVY